MTVPKLQTSLHMVQSMKQIRDEISAEIKDMSFLEERAFLDKLLKEESLKPMSVNAIKKP